MPPVAARDWHLELSHAPECSLVCRVLDVARYTARHELLPLGSYHFLRSSHAEFSYDARDAFICARRLRGKHLHDRALFIVT